MHATYGEIKSEVIRLKYKQGHDLAGIENGNRVVRMVLTAPSIPYSLQMGDEWCRIIHNNQQRICSHCNEVGHSRKDCPPSNVENVTNLVSCPLTAKPLLCTQRPTTN